MKSLDKKIIVLTFTSLITLLLAYNYWMPDKITITNPSKGTSPDKPSWWVITVREGPSSDFDLVRFLEPRETAVAVGRDKPGTWLLLGDGGWVASSVVIVKGNIEALPVVSVSPGTG